MALSTFIFVSRVLLSSSPVLRSSSSPRYLQNCSLTQVSPPPANSRARRKPDAPHPLSRAAWINCVWLMQHLPVCWCGRNLTPGVGLYEVAWRHYPKFVIYVLVRVNSVRSTELLDAFLRLDSSCYIYLGALQSRYRLVFEELPI
jgi:hypothetical protein